MLKEARGRARFEKTGALRIYVPKDLVQSTIFPFKNEGTTSFDILIRIQSEKGMLVIEKYR